MLCLHAGHAAALLQLLLLPQKVGVYLCSADGDTSPARSAHCWVPVASQLPSQQLLWVLPWVLLWQLPCPAHITTTAAAWLPQLLIRWITSGCTAGTSKGFK
jgi:hypothetical protein